jgi:hypothetical protein
MPKIDISVEPDLQDLFNLPSCDDLALPAPSKLKIQLPTGSTISAFADISKGIPNDCSMTFSLMMQIAPFLGAFDCLLRVLKLLKPLIEVVKSLGPPPDPIKLPSAIEDFVKAAVDLAPCLLVPTPANIIPFLRDLLCLIRRVLKCFHDQLTSLLTTMHGLELKLQLAQSTGNSELLTLIVCAQQNASTQAEHLTNSLEPVGVLLDLAGSLFDIAGVPTIKLPTVGQTDLAGLTALAETVQEVLVVLTVATDALGGCGE